MTCGASHAAIAVLASADKWSKSADEQGVATEEDG
jgi:hypothetical protein